ncbi:unnamed protein product [Cochlearia groenlandica]
MDNLINKSVFVPLNQTTFTHYQELMKEEDFPLEFVDQSKPSSFLQDFHHLDHHHHHNDGSTSLYNAILEHGFHQNNIVDNFYDESKPHLMNQATQNSYFTHNNNHQEINMVNEQDHKDLDEKNMMMNHFKYSLKEITKPMNFVMTEEVSSDSDDNHCYKTTIFNKTKPFLTRKLSSSSSSWKGNTKSTLVKGQWTAQQDSVLVQLVAKYGVRKWQNIAKVLPGKIGKQCRERWHNHLRPNIKKEPWSEEEDKMLIESHKEIGNKWAEMAKRLPGRTENSIKNHWNATKRRQFSKRKCKSKYSKSSLLQDYIKSLDLGVLSASSVPARGRRRECNKKKKEKEKEKQEEVYEEDRVMPEYVFSDGFGYNEKMFEEGICSIDSLLDDIPQHDIVHGI